MKNSILLIAISLLALFSTTTYAAGDAAAGKAAFAICASCHGQNGEGMEVMKAPKLAGQQAWYTLSSLKRFKDGTRGATDPAAITMLPMAKMLSDKQMEDVSAYIETLK